MRSFLYFIPNRNTLTVKEAARFLGVIQGCVRVADEVYDVLRIARAQCDTDAGGQEDFLAADIEGLRDGVEDFLREVPRHFALS